LPFELFIRHSRAAYVPAIDSVESVDRPSRPKTRDFKRTLIPILSTPLVICMPQKKASAKAGRCSFVRRLGFDISKTLLLQMTKLSDPARNNVFLENIVKVFLKAQLLSFEGVSTNVKCNILRF